MRALFDMIENGTKTRPVQTKQTNEREKKKEKPM